MDPPFFYWAKNLNELVALAQVRVAIYVSKSCLYHVKVKLFDFMNPS